MLAVDDVYSWCVCGDWPVRMVRTCDERKGCDMRSGYVEMEILSLNPGYLAARMVAARPSRDAIESVSAHSSTVDDRMPARPELRSTQSRRGRFRHEATPARDT